MQYKFSGLLCVLVCARVLTMMQKQTPQARPHLLTTLADVWQGSHPDGGILCAVPDGQAQRARML